MLNLLEIGNKIKNERGLQKMNQGDLAKKCGFLQNKVSRIESGLIDITITDLLEICKALNIGFERILSEDKELIPAQGIEQELITNYRQASDKEKQTVNVLLNIGNYQARNIDIDKETSTVIRLWKQLDVKYKKAIVNEFKKCLEMAQKDKINELESSLVKGEKAGVL